MWDKSEEIDYGEHPSDDALRVRPQDQTIEEWLADYDRFKDLPQNEFRDSEEIEMKVREGAVVDFDPAPIGMHVSRCIRIIDLGTAVDNMYGKPKHDVFFMWEIPGQLKTYTKKGENGQADQEITEPFTVSKYYNATLTDGSHLRTDLESWRSKPFTEQELQGFELRNVIAAPCMINVIHKPRKNKPGQVNAVVTTVTPMPKIDGMVCPPQAHPSVFFSLDPEEFDPQIYESLSQGLKARVMQSDEYKYLLSLGKIPNTPAQGQAPQTDYSQPQQGAVGMNENQPPVDDGFDDIPF